MENNLPIHLEEVLLGSADQKISKQISKLHRQGKIRKIAPRLYTSNLTDAPGEIVRRNLFIILGDLYPGALISHRSALEFRPTTAGHIFLTYKYTKKIELPGITVRLLEGPNPISGDNPFTGQLFASQQARALLENLQLSKRPGPTSKTLTIPEIEEKLEQVIRVNGEDELNRLRDKARDIATQISLTKEFARLNRLISALLTTHSKEALTSSIGTARALGLPYDPHRIRLFEELFRSLRVTEFKNRPDRNESVYSFRNFAFFESYFSNYIEGTVFEVEEAKEIISSGNPLPTRDEDSHDVLGTYQIVSNRIEMSRTPNTAEELISILQGRHKILMGARMDKNPGLFKNKNNRAGQTTFVDFNLVRGTLVKSFDFLQALTHPFAKAAYLMFVISEIHPFLDGNGRIARVMMNAELTAQGQSKIIIPLVFRDDYMGVLRKLTRQQEAEPYIRMLQRAFEFSESVYGDDMNDMQRHLENCNAFLESSEGKLKIIEKEQ